MNLRKRLRQLLEADELLIAPGAYDAFSARVIERAGFNAVYMTGYGASASRLGMPDVGLLTMTEMARQASDIAGAVNIPLIADGDTGYGNPLNVIRTIQEYEKAGVSAIQLEDQVFPKRCGHMLGREVIAMEDMVQKLHAALDARQDPDFHIIARTDARTAYGLDAALERGHAYDEAGADIIFIESPENEDELRKIAAAFPHKPTLANMVEGGRSPVLSKEALEEAGFALALYPLGPLYAAAKAVRDYADTLSRVGTTAAESNDMVSFEEFNDLVGLSDYNAKEERYGVLPESLRS